MKSAVPIELNSPLDIHVSRITDLARKVHNMSQISSFFNPTSVAFVGATENESKLGGRRYRTLVEGGFNGPIYPVNPWADSLRGLKAYKSLTDINGPVELAVIAVPRVDVIATLQQCTELNVPAIMIITSGFGEVDTIGKTLERDMLNLITGSGGRMIGPNSAGLYSANSMLNLGGAEVPSGPIALISQSGNLLLDFNLRGIASGTGFSRQIAIGNATDLDGVDLIEDCLNDPMTKVILAYFEGFKMNRGRALADLVKYHQSPKPIILLMPGKTSTGRQAALTHTGAMAGEDRVADAAFRETGIIRANSVESAWVFAEALCLSKTLNGSRIAVISDGGGHATILADSLGLFGFSMPKFSSKMQGELLKFLPSRAAMTNPLDFAGVVESDPTVLPKAVDICLNSTEIDGVAVAGHFGGYHRIGGAKLEKQELLAAKKVADLTTKNPRPIIFQSIHSDRPTKSHNILRKAGVPVVRTPETAALAFTALRRNKERSFSFKEKVISNSISPLLFEKAKALFKLANANGSLSEPESRQFLAAAGLNIPNYFLMHNQNDPIRLKKPLPPLAMKLITPSLFHRSDKQAVLLDINGEDEIRDGVKSLKQICEPGERKDARILVTPMIKSGLEMICGGSRDPQFGPVVMVGIGGVAVEVIDDIKFGLAPLNKENALKLINGIRAQSLLDGYRGGVIVDRSTLADTLVILGEILDMFDEIRELDLNPLIMNKSGLFIADARITLKH